MTATNNNTAGRFRHHDRRGGQRERHANPGLKPPSCAAMCMRWPATSAAGPWVDWPRAAMHHRRRPAVKVAATTSDLTFTSNAAAVINGTQRHERQRGHAARRAARWLSSRSGKQAAARARGAANIKLADGQPAQRSRVLRPPRGLNGDAVINGGHWAPRQALRYSSVSVSWRVNFCPCAHASVNLQPFHGIGCWREPRHQHAD